MRQWDYGAINARTNTVIAHLWTLLTLFTRRLAITVLARVLTDLLFR